MNILLANLGNRNINYNGKDWATQSPEFKNKYGSFRKWTEFLLENWEDHKNNLGLSILDILLDKKIEKLDRIILFYSDHPEGEFREQDTVYEATMVSSLIRERYNFANIHLDKIECRVVDNEALLQYYRKKLKNIDLNFNKPNYIICDAGGTAQQKASLKIITEFLIPEERYEVWYVNFNGQLEFVHQREYRNIIEKEQAIGLIHSGEYRAAASILEYEPVLYTNSSAGWSWEKKIFRHIYWRFFHNKKEALFSLGGLNPCDEILTNYLRQIPESNNDDMAELFGKDWLTICDRFYKVIFYFHINNISSAIITLSQFYEDLMDKSLEKLGLYDLYGSSNAQNDTQKDNLANFFLENYGDTLHHKKDFNPRIGSVSTHIMILKSCEIDSLKKIAASISPFVDYTDNTIKDHKTTLLNIARNKIAHEGKLYTSKDLHGGLYYLENLIQTVSNLMKLSKNNLFADLNSLMEGILRR